MSINVDLTSSAFLHADFHASRTDRRSFSEERLHPSLPILM